MTQLTLNPKENEMIHSKLLQAINSRRNWIIKKINIFIIISNFLLLVSLLISAIYIKENVFYFLIILPIVLIVLLPIILIKIDAQLQIKDIQEFVNNNNELISNLINKEINENDFKIKSHSKMYSKNKNFTNEIIKQAIKQLREL
ncbi:MAG: hypothetical protein RSE26_00385 [Malacoplasma sp.]